MSEAREAARKTDGTKGEWFYREGLLYRRWTPRGRGDESEVEQLDLPKACRHVALVMSHDIPIAGHLGRDKTRQRLLRRFFWPTVFRESIAGRVESVRKLPKKGFRRLLWYHY